MGYVRSSRLYSGLVASSAVKPMGRVFAGDPTSAFTGLFPGVGERSGGTLRKREASPLLMCPTRVQGSSRTTRSPSVAARKVGSSRLRAAGRWNQTLPYQLPLRTTRRVQSGHDQAEPSTGAPWYVSV